MAATVESLRKAIGKKKQSMAFAWLADLLCDRGELDEAKECVTSGLEAFPDSVEGHLVLSKILVAKEEWDSAIQACEFVLLRNSCCLSALRRMGDAYAAKGDAQNSKHYYLLLRNLDPLDPFWTSENAPNLFEETPTSESAEPLSAAEATAADVSLDELLKDQPLDLPDEPLIEKSPETIAPQAAAPVESAPAPAETTPAEKTAPQASESSTDEDDPFASFATLASAEDENDGEVSFNDLESSLNSAIAGFAPTNTDKDVFPAEEIEGNDISTALSGIFGSTEVSEPEPVAKEEPAETLNIPPAEDKPQTLSDAFDDIFGEDELPEEFVPSKAAEKPAETSLDLPTEDLKLDETSAPAENVAPISEEKSEAKSKAGNSADDVLNLDEPASAQELDKSVTNSFDSLFGSDLDDLPTEDLKLDEASAPAENAAPISEEKSEAKSKAENSADDVLNLDEPASAQELDKSVTNSFDSLFGSDSDDFPTEDLKLDEASAPAENAAPISEEKPEEKSETENSADDVLNLDEPASAQELNKSVTNSFDSLFGSDSDDLPTEDLKLDETSAPAENVAPISEEKSEAKSEAENSADDVLNLDEPASAQELNKSVTNSFDSLFGSDSDDFPTEYLKFDETSAPAENAVPISKEKPEEKSEAKAEPENSADDVLNLDEPASAQELNKSVTNSFDSLFGSDSDDFPTEYLKFDETSAPAENAVPISKEKPEEKSEAKAEPENFADDVLNLDEPASAQELNKSVTNSFDSLFGSDSDDLPEDPTTSTRTLAEIYFEQGVYDEAEKIYRDLIRKEPEDESLRSRLAEIEKIRNEKNP